MSEVGRSPAGGTTAASAPFCLGKALLAELIHQGRIIGHHTIVALIDSEQSASIVLHEHAGFARVGRLHQVGYKFGRWLDVIYMQMML